MKELTDIYIGNDAISFAYAHDSFAAYNVACEEFEKRFDSHSG